MSRQAVSKWESAQLFGVTTDYLLKDALEDEELVEKKDR